MSFTLIFLNFPTNTTFSPSALFVSTIISSPSSFLILSTSAPDVIHSSEKSVPLDN